MKSLDHFLHVLSFHPSLLYKKKAQGLAFQKTQAQIHVLRRENNYSQGTWKRSAQLLQHIMELRWEKNHLPYSMFIAYVIPQYIQPLLVLVGVISVEKEQNILKKTSIKRIVIFRVRAYVIKCLTSDSTAGNSTILTNLKSKV